LWAERGYVALAMDLSGRGPDGQRLPDGGPDQDEGSKFRDFRDDEARDLWTYHAVAAVLRGHSLLAAQKEVDASRVGITGISWGGYLTCIVAGIDDRLKVAVPVYGCGFIHENSAWVDSRFSKMMPEQRDRWVKYFEPSKYLPGVRCPILFVNGTTDFAYPLDSYQKSYRLVPRGADLCVKVGMKHGHKEGWSIPEIDLYVDAVLKKGVPLPKVGKMEIVRGEARVAFRSNMPITKAELHYTTDSGPWQKRNWQTIDAEIQGNTAGARLPQERPWVCFMTVTDERGAVASTEHVEL
ncbi:MAG: prolyl oligopeptidase family serine peptidase, partial [Verrucomicrobia bacterium]|nr:prolyl oligopeptidase family serine peptidase [Verrucomicrobiota bacterium]